MSFFGRGVVAPPDLAGLRSLNVLLREGPTSEGRGGNGRVLLQATCKERDT